MENLGTYHISQNIQNYESARSNFFTLIIEDLGDLVYPQFSYTGENADNEYVTGKGSNRSAQDVIKLSVNKSFVPHFDLGVIEVKRGNSVVKFADTPTWQSGTLDFQDFVGLEIKNVLMAWQALAYDVNTDTQGRAGSWEDSTGVTHQGYKHDCRLVEYTPDHQQVRYWDLKGCWISSITESPFDIEASGSRQISITLQYDRAIMKMPDNKFSKN